MPFHIVEEVVVVELQVQAPMEIPAILMAAAVPVVQLMVAVQAAQPTVRPLAFWALLPLVELVLPLEEVVVPATDVVAAVVVLVAMVPREVAVLAVVVAVVPATEVVAMAATAVLTAAAVLVLMDQAAQLVAREAMDISP